MVNRPPMDLPLARLCGQLIVGGFGGPPPPASFLRAVHAGERGGAILFKRNLTADLAQTAELNFELSRAAPSELPLLLAVDQEGGRVARLGPPALRLPPMRAIGRAIGDPTDRALATRAAARQGAELAALGFTTGFAPVLDVDTRADNPIIGDRAFSSDPAEVAALGIAWARGLADAGVLACGKHFPGHGDTTADSHLELPVVAHDRARLDAVELAPFAAAARAGVPMFMTAHVVYPALDPSSPATLSRAVCTDLRRELGFDGVLVSDDLEMKAISAHLGIEEAAVRAIDAGCDALLVCSDEALQARAHEALVTRAARDGAFRARCEEAAGRFLAARRRAPPRPTTRAAELARVFEASRAVAEELAARGAWS
jgi:beta-N-acetylhexosaminidase